MRFLLFVFVLLLPAQAFADKAAADACAAKLPPAGQQIYAATAPSITPSSDIPKVMKSKVVPLVRAGQMSPQDARANVQAAGQCLSMIKS